MTSDSSHPLKKGYRLGLLSGLTWGIDTTLLALALAISPFSSDPDMVLSGVFVCCLIHICFETLYMSIIVGIKGCYKQLLPSLKTRGGLATVIGGVLGGPIAMTCYLMAIEYTGAGITTTVSATYPLIGSLLATRLLRERVSLQVWIGILLAFFGILYAGTDVPLTERSITGIGILFAFITAVGWGLESVCCRYATHHGGLQPHVALLIREYVCLLAYILISPFFMGGIENMTHLVLSLMSYTDSFAIVALASCFGALSMYLWYQSISHIGAARGLCLNITYCVWTSLFACLIFHTLPLTGYVIGGALITAAGVGLALWNRKSYKTSLPNVRPN